jgi:hypothetical protein
MAKGNRESKKPKKDKVKTIAANKRLASAGRFKAVTGSGSKSARRSSLAISKPYRLRYAA